MSTTGSCPPHMAYMSLTSGFKVAVFTGAPRTACLYYLCPPPPPPLAPPPPLTPPRAAPRDLLPILRLPPVEPDALLRPALLVEAELRLPPLIELPRLVPRETPRCSLTPLRRYSRAPRRLCVTEAADGLAIPAELPPALERLEPVEPMLRFEALEPALERVAPVEFMPRFVPVEPALERVAPARVAAAAVGLICPVDTALLKLVVLIELLTFRATAALVLLILTVRLTLTFTLWPPHPHEPQPWHQIGPTATPPQKPNPIPTPNPKGTPGHRG